MIEEATAAELIHAIRSVGLSESIRDADDQPANIVDTTADIAAAIYDQAEAVRELAESRE